MGDSHKDFERGFGKSKVTELGGTNGRGGGPIPDLFGAEEIKAGRLKWLWTSWIAVGGITFLTGDPGIGKGLFLADLIARITRGLKLPDATTAPRGGAVVCTVEENYRGALRPRLEAAGAALKRVTVFAPGVSGASGPDGPFEGLPKGIGRLRAIVEKKRARLLVLDPLVDFLAHGTDPNAEVAVSEALAPLARLAEELGIAVICTRHLNKKSESQALYRMLGSTAFIAKARTIIQLRLNPEDENGRLLVCVKNNYAPKPAAIAFRIVEGSNKVARINWGEPLSKAEEEELEAAADIKPVTLKNVCEQVSKLLDDGEADAKSLRQAVMDAGGSPRTIWRAYKKLGVLKRADRDEKTGQIVRWLMRLPRDKA
jgi:putative DNA primase/helicase